MMFLHITQLKALSSRIVKTPFVNALNPERKSVPGFIYSCLQKESMKDIIAVIGVILMHDELTAVDIKKMQEEIDYRTREVRPKLIEDLKTARAFGDLSENYEYKAAKQELRRCDSRLRYLKRMIATAKVISASGAADQVGLFDRVGIYIEEDDETEKIELVTTLRQDALKGYISKESPLGKAVMGKRVGDRVEVKASDSYSYYVVIRSIEKGADDASLPISSF